jgi:hypothetical protein
MKLVPFRLKIVTIIFEVGALCSEDARGKTKFLEDYVGVGK